MITGEAVRSFTIMFLEMWSVDKNLRNMPLELFEKYLDIVPDKESEPGDGFIMPYGDSPLDNEAVGEQVYMDILYTAKDYVHIMTPYLIIDEEMINALIFAAQRGVEVKLILPHIPDKKYAYLLARLSPEKNAPDYPLYEQFSHSMMAWALDAVQRHQLITAIYIYVYQNRKGGDTDGRME